MNMNIQIVIVLLSACCGGIISWSVLNKQWSAAFKAFTEEMHKGYRKCLSDMETNLKKKYGIK